MRDMNQYLQDFDNLPFEKIQSAYRKKMFLRNLEKFGEIKSVLEVGCGISSIYEQVNFDENFLVEPIKDFCDRLSNRADTSKLVIVNKFLEDWEIEKEFDLVVLSCIIHEVENPDKFLAKAISLLKPGGILYIDVPNAESFHRYLAVSTGYLTDIYQKSATQTIMQQSSRVFSRKTLLDYLKKFNLNVFECETYFIKPFHHQKMQELINVGAITLNDLDGFFDLGYKLKELGSEIYAIAIKSS